MKRKGTPCLEAVCAVIITFLCVRYYDYVRKEPRQASSFAADKSLKNLGCRCSPEAPGESERPPLSLAPTLSRMNVRLFAFIQVRNEVVTRTVKCAQRCAQAEGKKRRDKKKIREVPLTGQPDSGDNPDANGRWYPLFGNADDADEPGLFRFLFSFLIFFCFWCRRDDHLWRCPADVALGGRRALLGHPLKKKRRSPTTRTIRELQENREAKKGNGLGNALIEAGIAPRERFRTPSSVSILTRSPQSRLRPSGVT